MTALTLASTLPFPPCLPRLHRRLLSTSSSALLASTSTSPPSTMTASTRLRHHNGASMLPRLHVRLPRPATLSATWHPRPATLPAPRLATKPASYATTSATLTTTLTTAIFRTASSTMAPPPSRLATSTSAQRATALYELLVGFHSSRSISIARSLRLRGDVSLWLLFSSLIVCDAPATIAGDVRVYLVV